MECDAPTTKIYRFHGSIVHPWGERVPVGKDNLLLRECVLKNTDFVEGLVVYAGKVHFISNGKHADFILWTTPVLSDITITESLTNLLYSFSLFPLGRIDSASAVVITSWGLPLTTFRMFPIDNFTAF